MEMRYTEGARMGQVDETVLGLEDGLCPWCGSHGILSRHYLLDSVMNVPVKGGVVLRCPGCTGLSRRTSLLLRVVWAVMMLPLVPLLAFGEFHAVRAAIEVSMHFDMESAPLLAGLVAIVAVGVWALVKILGSLRRLVSGAPARVAEDGGTGF